MHILKHDNFFDLMLCRIASGIEKRLLGPNYKLVGAHFRKYNVLTLTGVTCTVYMA